MNVTEPSKTIADAEQDGMTFTDEAKVAFREMEEAIQRMLKITSSVPRINDKNGNQLPQVYAVAFVGIAHSGGERSTGSALLGGRGDQIISSFSNMIGELPVPTRAAIARNMIESLP